MIYQPLSRANLRVSRIGLGTVQFGLDYGLTKKKTQGEVDDILEVCYEQGLNLLDTARGYGDSEDKIGHFLKRHQQYPFVIATKLSKIEKSIVNDPVVLEKHVRDSIKISLQKLSLPRIDILFLHQTDKILLKSGAFWEVIEKMRSEELFQLFGISVYEPDETKGWVTERSQHVDCVQLPYNAFDQRFAEILSLLKEKRIDVISRSAFLKGMMTAKEDSIPAELKSMKPWRDKLAVIAGDSGLSLSELALGFVLKNPLIKSTIIGVNSAEELKKNLQCFDLLEKVSSRYDELKNLTIADETLIDPRRWREI
jgi:aryl-alcohol dehydrogenase-like predicted oxidoreductase